MHFKDKIMKLYVGLLLFDWVNGSNCDINPIRPGLFSRLPGPGRGGGLSGPDVKNQGQHQPIEMKLGMSHYGHIKAFLMQNLSLVALLVLEI